MLLLLSPAAVAVAQFDFTPCSAPPLSTSYVSYLRGAATVTSQLALALSDKGTGAGSFSKSEKQSKPCHTNPRQMAKV